MPRFVILTHDHPHLHWDFMLEWNGKLRTWRLEKEPALGCEIRAEPLPDHRLKYLDYEGPVSGDRGEVHQWDAGKFELIEESANGLIIELNGRKLAGRAVLRHESASRSTFRIDR